MKFILLTFIYAIIKQTNDKLKIEFNQYKKKKHYRYIGESIFSYILYLFPYFIYKDYKKYSKYPQDKQLKDIANKIDDSNEYKDFTHFIMFIENRKIFLIYDKKLDIYE